MFFFTLETWKWNSKTFAYSKNRSQARKTLNPRNLIFTLEILPKFENDLENLPSSKLNFKTRKCLETHTRNFWKCILEKKNSNSKKETKSYSKTSFSNSKISTTILENISSQIRKYNLNFKRNSSYSKMLNSFRLENISTNSKIPKL